ncbi:hypothetical protein [Bacillus sp. B15-48]|uniref:hypothetical protein n=1 Tax=Bacillus sp. B15-48 TaxID=1548601 RepID=UPI00193F491B|nr:hypothetical protein [Bacillus sp. B15-48]MBM4764826.1 hypothetical protein [Bacillus sp. B15-48]
MKPFLIVRRDDFIHFGIQWSDFRIEYNETLNENLPRLVALNDNARVTLTFPPQVLGEEIFLSNLSYSAYGTLGSRLSGTSQVEFKVPAETSIELNAEGILKALTSPGVFILPSETFGENSTAIEIPWGLIMSVVTGDGEGKVVSDHPVLPVTSTSRVTGLWYAQLRSTAGNAEDAGLYLKPLYYRPHDIVNFVTNAVIGPPLASIDRGQIYQNSQVSQPPFLPYIRRLELSALGGTLSCTAKWRNFEWDHEVVLGRDQKIRKQTAGVLYPFGHKAYVEVFTERKFKDGNAVLLNTNCRLVVTEPIRNAEGDERLAREFPFDKIEILQRSFDIKCPNPGESLFIPKVGEDPLQFPLRCAGTNGDVIFNVPLVFANTAFSHNISDLIRKWGDHCKIPLPGVPIDLIRDRGRSIDVRNIFEVHELTISSVVHNGMLFPKVEQLKVELPALRELQPHKPSLPIPVKYTQEFKDFGVNDIPLEPFNDIDIDFTERPELSGGLIAPKFLAKKISRSYGPIPDPKLDVSTIFKDATLLGLPLESIIQNYKDQEPPKIIQTPGNPPGAKMEWQNLRLTDCGPFRSKDSTATLIVERSSLKSEICCQVKSFEFVLPKDLVKLKFESLEFTQKPGCAPDVEIDGLKIEFAGALKLVDELLKILNDFLGNNGPKISTIPSGISASYTLGIPDVPAGMFVMRNVAVYCGVEIPFSPNPVTMSLGFGKRDNPFNLSVLMFGGGGYIDVQFGNGELTKLEGLMEFGGMVAVNFIIGNAEVHALGGVRFIMSGGPFDLEAFIRIGGSINILGLVSVAVELVVKLNYRPTNRLVGRATLVIDVDFTLFSESVTIDSGEWELLGSIPARRNVPISLEEVDSGITSLLEYYEAFAD